jgi:hypothetical protein
VIFEERTRSWNPGFRRRVRTWASSMAFPLPAHLPRKKQPQDVSSALLSTISETSVKTLNSDLAASWVAELDQSIQLSQVCLHDVPPFCSKLSVDSNTRKDPGGSINLSTTIILCKVCTDTFAVVGSKCRQVVEWVIRFRGV